MTVEAARSAAGGNADLFVEAELDRKTGFVQAQLLYTFRLYRAVQLNGNPQLTPLQLADATIESLGTKSFRTQLNGRLFHVDELRYAIFPYKSGQLNIPSLTLTARLRDGRQSRGGWSIGGTGKLVRRNTPALSAQILPVPAQWPANAPWLPLQNLKLEQNWSKPVDQLTLGDSVTRTITMTAIGLPGAQLPQVEQQQVPTGIRLYPEQPKSDNITGENGITGLGISSVALLVTEPGHYRLPPIKVPWWDVDRNQLRYAELPSASMHIEALQLDTSNPTAMPGLGSSEGLPGGMSGEVSGIGGSRPLMSNPWYWSTLALLLAWLATAYAWLQPHRRVAQTGAALPEVLQASDEKRLFKQTLEACRNDDPGQVRKNLRSWGAEIVGEASRAGSGRVARGGPEHGKSGGSQRDMANQAGSRQDASGNSPRPTLRELTRYVGDGDLGSELNRLDKCLYGKTPANWQGAKLASALEAWRGSYVQAQKRSKASTLAELNY